MQRKYIVTLTAEERERLRHLVRAGSASARVQTHARILLKTDTSAGRRPWSDRALGRALDVCENTIRRTRERFIEHGLDRALYSQKSQRHYPHKIDGAAEAHLVALACSHPPEGFARWSMRLLAARLIELEVVVGVSHETVRQALKKTRSSHGSSASG